MRDDSGLEDPLYLIPLAPHRGPGDIVRGLETDADDTFHSARYL